MSIPTWTPGEVLSASDVNSWFVPKVGYFTGSTQTFNATGFAAVNGMSVSLAIATYIFDGGIYWTPNQSAGSAKFEFITPDTLTLTSLLGEWNDVAVSATPGATPTPGNSGLVTALSQNMQSSTMGAADRYWDFQGVIVVSAAGTLNLEAACSNASDTFGVKLGTFFRFQRVA